ncbi:dolichyl-diphosphooligosaccharide--protein glycosyltransferase subunit 1 [Drechslerella dactyloides]|uniref:Dolichyl-diphosphooligosaccharide--protein glycosyltransferase subunit 1 n=1 Tax=Drechslerella dactyloides TaxID=74499 RepID=A0AAD6IZ49_DREDA|nr:dolichyl-diphosphooligosaccharide--protein glycosyltransferase subunit 1 [Drechslerella dactyloides]
MRSIRPRVTLCATLLLAASHLASSLEVPQVFKNTNLLRTIDASKAYIRETIAVIIENTSDKPQTEYYLPLSVPGSSAVSFVECKDKKEGTPCKAEPVEDSSDYPVKYYKITLPATLKPKGQVTLAISASITGALEPIPAVIGQSDKQFLSYTGYRYVPTAYLTEKQKTKFRAANGEIPDYTEFGGKDVEKSGYTVTYGPYDDKKAWSSDSTPETFTIRFEFTMPIIYMEKLERDIEVSHWGNNLAFEERYWMTNNGAKLRDQFSRLTWATTSYYNPPTAAIKSLLFPLRSGSKDAYYTDEVGNVSTSKFRSDSREAILDIKPRFPIFGGWNYSFVVGWNNDLPDYLRKSKGDGYILKVPLLQGPSQSTSYGSVEVRIILPEGATDVTYSAPFAIDKEERSLHKTFMDTLGRTTIKLTVNNVVDELKNRDIINKLAPEVNRILFVKNLRFVVPSAHRVRTRPTERTHLTYEPPTNLRSITSYQVSSEELFDLFGKFGPIRQIRQGIANNTKGTAFIVYEEVGDAKTACDKLNGFNFQNRYLVVLYHQPEKMARSEKDLAQRQEELEKLKKQHGIE